LPVLWFVPHPAAAQVAGSVFVDSDDRYRGYSLSDGRPTATAQLSYDHASGLYLNAAVTGVARRDGPDFLGYQANLGFARRVSSTISLDAGLTHSVDRYRYLGNNYPASYDEAYIGANAHNVSARVSYSPHYFQSGVSTLYGEIEAGTQTAEKWRVSGHVGVLTYLAAPALLDTASRYDWRVGVSRQLGAFEIHTALSGGGPRDRYPYVFGQSGTALTVGASLNF
jgi:uncharacterized protein (TIGR02001 family)